MTLLIALLGAAVLLSGLVLLAGFRRRGAEPFEFASSDSPRASDLVDAGPSANAWIFGGTGGQA